MTKHQKPHGDMSAAQLVALFQDDTRHANALNYELSRCKLDVLVTLAYHEFAPPPVLADIPARLSELAYDEIERRDNALSMLRLAIGR